MKAIPPIDHLFDLFYVDSSSPTGLRWAEKRRARDAGTVAGHVHKTSNRAYIEVPKYGRYLSYRIVQCMKTGEDSPLEVDHIDRDCTNNHPFNLRWANHSEQQVNTPSRPSRLGVRNVYRTRSGLYEVRVWRGGLLRRKGGFATIDEAVDWRASILEGEVLIPATDESDPNQPSA